MYILMEVGVQEYHQTIINVIDLMVISVLILKTILMVLEVLMTIIKQIDSTLDGRIVKIQKPVQTQDSLHL
jgi:hypothetical protein